MTTTATESSATKPEGRTYGKSVRKNTIILTGCRFLGLFIGLVVTPIMVKTLGEDVFGLFAVLLSSAATLGAFDFGLGASFLKYLNEHLTKGENELAKAIATVALIFYVALAAIFVPLSIALAPYFIGFLKIGAVDKHLASTCLVMAVGYVMVSGLAYVPSQILTALHRLDIVSIVGLVVQVLGQSLSVYLVLHGYGIMGIVAALYIQTLLGATINLLFAWRLIGWPFGNLRLLTRGRLGQMAKYGGWIQLAGLTGIVQNQSDRIVIGMFVSMSSVTAYEIGNKIAFLSRTFPITLCVAAFPAISSIEATSGRERLISVYIRSSNMLAFVTMFFSGLLIGGGEHIINMWMKGPIKDSTAILIMLLISYAVNNLTGIGTAVYRAQAKPQYETSYGWIQLAVNIILSVVLGIQFGLFGIVTGTLVGATAGSIFFLGLFHRNEKLGWWGSVGKTLAKIIAIAAAAGIAYRLLLQTVSLHTYTNRIVGLALLASYAAVYTLIFAIASSVFVPDCVESIGGIGHRFNAGIRRILKLRSR